LTTPSQPNTSLASIFPEARLSPSLNPEQLRMYPIREQSRPSPILEQSRKSPLKLIDKEAHTKLKPEEDVHIETFLGMFQLLKTLVGQ
jgi:hypothetical protein